MPMGRAGVGTSDIDFLELNDCYTYTVLVTLEDYGFCAKGEGGVCSRSAAWSRRGSAL
jgi:acetyl-CoA acetyltransferase